LVYETGVDPGLPIFGKLRISLSRSVFDRNREEFRKNPLALADSGSRGNLRRSNFGGSPESTTLEIPRWITGARTGNPSKRMANGCKELPEELRKWRGY